MKILFLYLFFLPSILAKGPNDYDHEFKGCPLNSTCSKELGEARNEMIKLIEGEAFAALNTLKSKAGVLVQVWLRPEVKSSQYISWDSACPDHVKERKFQLALAPIKTLTPINEAEKKEIFYPYIYLEEEGTYRRIIVPRNSQPIFISGKNLYFAEELEGKYYGLKLNFNGNFEIVETPHIIERSRYVDCPASLKDITKDEALPQSPYNQFYCKEIWNRELKKFQKVIFPYSCS
jgi:hypothetical protein